MEFYANQNWGWGDISLLHYVSMRELQVTRGNNDLTLRNLAWAYSTYVAKEGSISYNSTKTKSILWCIDKVIHKNLLFIIST